MTDTTQSSPEFLRISLAAAMTLGLRNGTFYRGARLHCLNLLLSYDDGCEANCSYCGLRRGDPRPAAGLRRSDPGEAEAAGSAGSSAGSGPDGSFIRVEWPTFSLEEIIGRSVSGKNPFERICVSMIMHPRALADTIFLIRRLSGSLALPVSVLANPGTMEEGAMEDLLAAGADMATVAIDAATEDLFREHRGEGVGGPHDWNLYWRRLEEAALVFGAEKAGCHLICGLGETESEMVEAMRRVRRLGARSHLFSFYPEHGSLLEGVAPCRLSHFRRIQLARYLIDYDLADGDSIKYDEHGRIHSFGMEGAALDELVNSGKPFMTSGCPGASMPCACNRPYGDGPPGDIRSYPFALDRSDVHKIRKELATYQEVALELDLKA